MKDPGAMIGPATLTGQGTLRGEGRTCRTTRTEMGLLHRVSMAPHLHLARTRCHLTMVRATCLRRRHHRMLVVTNQTISPKCQTHRLATTSKLVLLTTSKVVLRGIKVVIKVTKGTQGRPTEVVTLATKVAHLVTLVATNHLPTKEATPTHRHIRVVAILATLVAAQATKVKEATRISNEHDHEYK